MGDLSTIYTEQNVIFCCIQDNVLILKVDAKYFISDVGKEIFHILKNLYIADKPITKRNLKIEVDKISEVEIKESEIDALFSLEEVDSKDFIKYYDDLKKEWVKFRIGEHVLRETLRETAKRSGYDIETLRNLTQEMQDTLNVLDQHDSCTLSPREMMDKYVNVLYKRETLNLNTTGCNYLDSILTEKFSPQTISIVFGLSGVGKSTFVRHLVNLCINKQIPSIYYTLEMSFDSTMDCIASQRLRIPLSDLHPDINGMMDQSVIDRIQNEKEKLKRVQSFRLKFDDVLSIDDLEKSLKDLRIDMKLPEESNIIVFIDLLTMLSDFNKGGDSKASNYENAMNKLHFLVRRQNVHIVGVVQSRRPSSRMVIQDIDDLDRFRPQIEELKNSGALQERARIVLGVFRKKHFALTHLPDDPETQIMEDIMEVSVLKQNMGRLGTVKYKFFPEMSKLVRYVEPE